MQSDQERREWLASLSHDKWLASLQKGDIVLVSQWQGDYVREVFRRTSTQIIVVRFGQKEERYAERFNAKTGRRVGSTSTNVSLLRQATSEKIKELRRTELVLELRRVSWNKFDLNTIEKVFAVIFEAEEQLKAKEQNATTSKKG